MGGDGSKPSQSVDRNSLYTGITRAEQSVTLIGHPNQFKQVITQNPSENRHTALPYELVNHMPQQTHQAETQSDVTTTIDEADSNDQDSHNTVEMG